MQGCYSLGFPESPLTIIKTNLKYQNWLKKINLMHKNVLFAGFERMQQRKLKLFKHIHKIMKTCMTSAKKTSEKMLGTLMLMFVHGTIKRRLHVIHMMHLHQCATFCHAGYKFYLELMAKASIL